MKNEKLMYTVSPVEEHLWYSCKDKLFGKIQDINKEKGYCNFYHCFHMNDIKKILNRCPRGMVFDVEVSWYNYRYRTHLLVKRFKFWKK